MTGAFSVTEVVTAARCPRQLVLLREGHRVTPAGGEAIGQVAHGALVALVRAAALDGALLRALSPAVPDETAVTAACYALAYPHVYQRAVELAPSVDGEALGRLDAVLRHLAGLMAGLLLRARTSAPGAAQALETVVVATERDVSLEISGFRINGRIDLICRDAGSDETWLWDLETFAGTDAAQEQQVVLYALASERAGLRARPALLHVTGERVELGPVQPSDPEATEMLQARLQDMSAWLSGTRPPPATRDTTLCRSCPAQEACWSRWGRTLDESAAPETSRPPAPTSVTAPPGARDRGAPPPPPGSRERNRPPATPPPLPPDARGSGRWPVVRAPDAGGVPTVAADARGSGRWAALRPTDPAGVPTVTADAGGSGGWPVAVGPDPDTTPALALPAPPLEGPPTDPGSEAVVVAVSVRESGRWMMARATPAQQPAVTLPPPAENAASGARVVSISPLPPTTPIWLGTMERVEAQAAPPPEPHRGGFEGPSQGPSYYRRRTPARLDPADLRKHVAVFGASGAGKTTFARTFVEEAVLAGIPALVFDGQGELAQLARPQPHIPPDLVERRDRFAASAEVRIYTPGSDAGLRVSLDPLRVPESGCSEKERAFCFLAVAENLLANVELPAAWRKRARGYVTQHLEAVHAEGTPVNLAQLIDRLSDPGGLADEPQLGKKSQREALVEQLRLLTTGPERMLFQRGRPLDIGGLVRPTEAGKTPLNVVWLNGLGDAQAKERFVAMVLSDLYAWALRNPSASPQLLFYLDEAGPFIPPRSEPASKAICKQLFQQGRKLGLCGLFCSQNFTDVDHKVLAQASTLAIGRTTATQDKERARRMLEAPGFDADAAVSRLAGAPSGRFLLRNPDRFATPTWVQGRPLLTVHGAPWGEAEISEHTPPALRDRWIAGPDTAA
jgi:CRISPR/Cas system-associated exonuclease Cas4 (RecB family)